MKIVHLCFASFYIDNYTYQENILPLYHKRMGNDVWVLASTFSFDEKGKGTLVSPGSYEIDGVKITRFAYKKGRAARILRRYTPDIRKELEKIAPDVIFIHGVQFLDIGRVVSYCKKHKNVAVYADNHADFVNSAAGFLSKRILHGVIWRHCAKKANAVTKKFYGVLPARTEFLKKMYKLPEEKVFFLPLGAEDDKVRAARAPETLKKMRNDAGCTDGDFLIVTAGKIDRNKPEVLNLMAAVGKNADPRVKLHVYGSIVPELRERFDALLRGGKVIYRGWLKPEDTYRVFCAADLLFFPGLHSVYWEQAVGAGCPAVFRRIDGFTHVDRGGNCLFVESGGEEEITAVLDRLTPPDSEEYRKIKKKAGYGEDDFFSYVRIARASIDA